MDMEGEIIIEGPNLNQEQVHNKDLENRGKKRKKERNKDKEKEQRREKGKRKEEK